MIRILLGVIVGSLTFAIPATAQDGQEAATSSVPITPALRGARSPFKVLGNLDVVIPGDGSDTFTTAKSVILAGWSFECLSGLQPQTQRIGEFLAYWLNATDLRMASLSTVSIAQRPDVPLALGLTCPAVGKNVGFLVIATPPDTPGDWTLVLDVATANGAGDVIFWQAQRQVRVWQAESAEHADGRQPKDSDRGARSVPSVSR